MTTSSVRPGDKFATWHGQKQTVSKIVDAEDMPLCRDTRTGKEFRPQVIMAATTVHNRGTPGQIYEARAGTRYIDVTSKQPIARKEPHNATTDGADYTKL